MTEPSELTSEEQKIISKYMSNLAKRPRPSRKKYFSEEERRAGAARRVREFRDRKKKEKENG